MNFLSFKPPANSHPRQNHLLAALPDGEWTRCLVHLELVEFPVGRVLCESDSAAEFVYFPTTAIISLMSITVEGGTSEVAIVGNEGVVGICAITGGRSMPIQTIVQSAGQGYRLRSTLFKTELERAGTLLHLLLRYTQSLITQIAQSAACNRHHNIEQQLSRRLLLALDRSPSEDLAITQERLACLLGVRREGITAAALKLQQAGVIRYQRGHISVLDREGLERRTCECYAAVAKENKRLLPAALSARRLLPMPIAEPMQIAEPMPIAA